MRILNVPSTCITLIVSASVVVWTPRPDQPERAVVRGDPPAVGVASSLLDPPDENRPPNSFAYRECVQKPECPEGLLLLTPEGNHLGCEAVSNSCSGACYTCAGQNAATYVCVQVDDPTIHCDIPPVYRIVRCGNIRRHDNGCNNSQGGYPGTPNGCYCDVGSQYTNLTDPCMIAECQ